MSVPEQPRRTPWLSCIRCGAPMRFEHGHEKCDRCGHIASCCEGEVCTLTTDSAGPSSKR